MNHRKYNNNSFDNPIHDTPSPYIKLGSKNCLGARCLLGYRGNGAGGDDSKLPESKPNPGPAEMSLGVLAVSMDEPS